MYGRGRGTHRFPPSIDVWTDVSTDASTHVFIDASTDASTPVSTDAPTDTSTDVRVYAHLLNFWLSLLFFFENFRNESFKKARFLIGILGIP